MIAFDTDVLTEILLGNAAFVARAAAIPMREQAVPVIVIEEIMRGRLNVIRQAEAGIGGASIARAYELFEETFRDFRRLHILSYTTQAETLYQQWRQQGIRIATHDLRIAALCIAHPARLISRNRRDYERVPGLMVEFWE
ncbi:MAG TPA: type II toxin-antitoxin system VapC family toxin [Candidatus Binatia bacterium]|jgi:tRNA(fMet)-specific endonuclease VapC